MSKFLETQVEPALLARARRGDAAAHAALFEAFGPPVLGLAWRMLGARDLADEILQDTFVEVLTKVDGFRGDAPFGAWLRRIAINKCLQSLRRRQRGEKSAPEAWPADERAAPDPGNEWDLETALRSLPATSRAVLWLHDVEGYTHREIGALLGKTTSFSKSRLARAHRSLRERLDAKRDHEAGRIEHACQR